MDSRIRGNDAKGVFSTFYEIIKILMLKKLSPGDGQLLAFYKFLGIRI